MGFTQDLFSSRRNYSDGNTRLGDNGRLWYDSITNTLRVGDGETPGGQVVGGSSSSLPPDSAGYLYNDGTGTLTWSSTTTSYGDAQVSAYLPSDPLIVQIQSNLSDFESYANATFGTSSYSDSNVAAYLAAHPQPGTYTDSNVAAYLVAHPQSGTYGDSNVALYLVSHPQAGTYSNSNVAAYLPTNGTITAIQANLGAYQTSTDSTLYSLNLSVNNLYANAGTQATAINSINANIGAYQSYANANVVTIQTNLSAYQSYANANAAAQQGILNTLNGRVDQAVNTTSSPTFANLDIGGILEVDGNVHFRKNLVVDGNINFIGNVTQTNITTANAVFTGDTYGFGALYAGVNAYTPLPYTVIQATANYPDYAQINFQNLDNSATASTEWVATAGNGTDSTNYIDLGIASGTWDGTQTNSLTTAPKPNDGWLYVQGNPGTGSGGNLLIGSIQEGKFVKVVTGSAGAGSIATTFSNVGITTANVNANYYLYANGVSILTDIQNQITGANAAIITANSALKSYTDTAISTAINNLIDSAPGTLDTLNELAANLAGEAGAIGSITNSITSTNANVTAANLNITNLQSNTATLTASINTINANLGSFQTYANATFGTSNYSNANVTAYLVGTSVPTANLASNVTINTATGTSFFYTVLFGNVGGNQLFANAVGTGLRFNPITGLVTATSAQFGTSVTTSSIVAASLGVNLFNSTATTISMGGAAANILIGNTSGTASNVIFGGTGVTGGQAIGNVYAGNIHSGTFRFANGVNILSTVTSTAQFAALDANIGAYEIWANANVGSLQNQITGANVTSQALNANVGSYQIWANANVGGLQNQVTGANATIQTISANLGAYQTWANANVGSLQNQITGANATIQTISANLGAYEIWANANVGSLQNQITGANTNIQTLNANVGSYQIWANANVGGLQNQITGANATIQTISANLGAYQTWANANVGSLQNQITGANATIQTLNANVGGYHIWANANVGGLQNQITGANATIQTISANLGSYQVYANSVVYSNVNVAAYLSGSTTGNVGAGNLTVVNNFSSNIIYANTYNYANGVSILSSITSNIQTISANLGAYQIWANANVGGLQNQITGANTTIQSISANLGAYQIWANANVGGLQNQITGANATIQTISANLGAYQTWANANIQTISANLGAYQTWANANVGGLQNQIFASNANIGAFQAYANTKIGTNTNSNLVVVSTTASTDTTTGALVVGGGAGIAGNVFAGGNISLGGIPNYYGATGGGRSMTVVATTGKSAFVEIIGSDTASGALRFGNISRLHAMIDTDTDRTLNFYVNGLGTGNALSTAFTVNSSLNATFSNLVTATGNIIASNFVTTGAVYATGNVISGNVVTGIVSAAGNITSTNITTGNISSTGNISTTNITASGNLTVTDGSRSNFYNYSTLGKGIDIVTTGSSKGAFLQLAGGPGGAGYVTFGNVSNVHAVISSGTDNSISFSTKSPTTGANLASEAFRIYSDQTARLSGNLTVGQSYGNLLITNGYINTNYIPTSVVGSAINVFAANTVGGTGYADFLRVTNSSGGSTNPTKTFRLNSTGGLEILNNAYNTVLLAVADTGNVALQQATVAGNGIPATNSISLGNHSFVYDDGNYHLTAKSGSIWFNSNDGSDVQINTQMPAGVTGGGLNVQGPIQSYALGLNANVSFISGSNAQSGVALQMKPDSSGAANQAIRDTSTAASTMYFDVNTGGATNGTFKWRSSSSFTELMALSSAQLVVNRQMLIGGGSQGAYVTINSTNSYNLNGPYGYLNGGGAGSISSGSSGTVGWSLQCSGRIQSGEVDVPSDERLKDIQGTIPLDKALQFVRAIDGILYTWKPGFGDEGLKSGFSAQGVHKAGFDHMVVPAPNDRVAGSTDADGFTSPDKFQLTLNYMEAIPYHHEVIKHLLDRIEQLEATVAKLTGNSL